MAVFHRNVQINGGCRTATSSLGSMILDKMGPEERAVLEEALRRAAQARVERLAHPTPRGLEVRERKFNPRGSVAADEAELRRAGVNVAGDRVEDSDEMTLALLESGLLDYDWAEVDIKDAEGGRECAPGFAPRPQVFPWDRGSGGR